MSWSRSIAADELSETAYSNVFLCFKLKTTVFVGDDLQKLYWISWRRCCLNGSGVPLSINNLRQDLAVAFETIDRWITILENLYFCFRILPYGLPRLRAATKERKLYMWDWSVCATPSARFENLVASNLLKYYEIAEFKARVLPFTTMAGILGV